MSSANVSANIVKRIQRKPWIDIAKGILILFVILGHVQYFAHDFVGIDDFKFVEKSFIVFITWYMPAFFVVTGYCTNYNISFKDFLLKNFKSLVVPCVLIGVFLSSWIHLFLSSKGLSYHNFLEQDYRHLLLTCGPWFLTALFVAKVLMYGILRYLKCNDKWTLLFLLGLMLVAASLYNKKIIYNVWYFEHALMLLPFMFVGVLLRKRQPNKKEKYIYVILGGSFLFLAILMKWLNLPYPYIHGVPGVFWGNFWLCFLMGTTVTLALFVICEKIGECRWLEFLGRHTLTIYLLQECVMVFFIKAYTRWQIGDANVLVVMALILATAFICAWIDVFIDKHVGFLKGKF